MKFYSAESGSQFEIRVERDQLLIIFCSAEAISYGAVLDLGEYHLGAEIKKLWERRSALPFSGLTWLGAKVVGSSAMVRGLTPVFENLALPLLKHVERSEAFLALFVPQTGVLKVQRPEESKSHDSKRRIRVMTVDDSPTVLKILAKMIESSPGLELVASTGNPLEAERLIETHQPDVLTLDIHMPHLNGLELLKRLHPRFHIPTIMVSSITPEEGPMVLETLENGAFDYFQKPEAGNFAANAKAFTEKILQAFRSKSVVLSRPSGATRGAFAHVSDRIILIGSSTGGTNALKEILTALPAEIPPIVITQHIPPVFSKAFADRLDKICRFRVKEAEDGDIVEANHVYIAPGGKHLGFEGKERIKITLSDAPPINHFKPSVDYMFREAQKLLARRKLVVVMLTGMGADGAQAMLELRQAGARTIAQDEASCVVFGMPKEAIDRGAVQKVVSLEAIADELIQSVNNS